MILISIILLLIFISILILTMKIKILLILRIGQFENKLIFQLKTLFQIIRVHKEYSLTELIESDNNDSEKEANSFSNEEIKFHFQKTIVPILKKMNITRFKWVTSIGIGDAANTGVVSGGLWSIKGIVLAFIHKHMRLTMPTEIIITPAFQKYIFDTTVECMLHTKAGHAIWVGYKMYRLWRKYKQNDGLLIDENRRTING